MCRLMVYKGVDTTLLADLLLRPSHSIIKQSYQAQEQLFGTGLNGDGFGVGWYNKSVDDTPCVFVSITPAWNNTNLKRLAEKISSNLFFSHVRAATTGSALNESNCHPFSYGKFLFMHNGHIEGFSKIKRNLLISLKEEYFNMIEGATDSEHAFAVFLDCLPRSAYDTYTYDELAVTMQLTLHRIHRLSMAAGVTNTSLLNFVITDGESVIACRYIPDDSLSAIPASLYLASGSKFENSDCGTYRMTKGDKREHVVIVASEPLTFHASDWMPVVRLDDG